MKKMAIALFLGAQFMSYQTSAQTYITGTTSWIAPVSVSNDIIVTSTGQLLIYADVEMAAGTSIHVEDGGRLYAINSRMYGKKNNQWDGLSFDPTSSVPQNLLALKLINCTIEDAETAVKFNGGIHRNYHIRASTFVDNDKHMNMISNTKMSFQVSEIISTQFLDATAPWPIQMNGPMNLSIYNSTFDYYSIGSSSGLNGLHLDWAENLLISGNTFNRVGRKAIDLHNDSKNVEIRENTFSAMAPIGTSSTGINYSGIEIGSSVTNTSQDILITKNNFVNADASNNQGIVGVWTNEINCNGLNITENVFEDYDRGIDVQNVIAGSNSIANNYFHNYEVAIKFRDANLALDILDIHCNRFEDEVFLLSTAIDGTQGTVTSAAVEIDPMNEFIDTDIDILYNLANGYLYYAIHVTNPNPPVTHTGVWMSSANNFVDCTVDDGGTGGGDPTGGEKSAQVQKLKGSVFPNPANDHVTIQFEGEFEYSIVDSKGSLILTGNSEGRQTISIHDFNSGVYFVHIIGTNGQSVEKLIVE